MCIKGRCSPVWMIGDGYQYLMLRLAAGHWPLPVFANNLFCCDTGHCSRVRKNTLSQITKIHLIHNFKSRGHLWRMIDGGPMLDRDLHNVTNGVMEWRLDRQNIFPGGVKYLGLGNIWPKISAVLLLAGRLGGLTRVPCWSQINLLYWPHLTRGILPGSDWLTLDIREKPEIPEPFKH